MDYFRAKKERELDFEDHIEQYIWALNDIYGPFLTLCIISSYFIFMCVVFVLTMYTIMIKLRGRHQSKKEKANSNDPPHMCDAGKKGDKKENKRRSCVTIATDRKKRDETSVHSPDFIHNRKTKSRLMKLYQLHKADLDSTKRFKVDKLLRNVTGNGVLPVMQGNEVRALLHVMEVALKKQMRNNYVAQPNHEKNMNHDPKAIETEVDLNIDAKSTKAIQDKFEMKEGKKDKRNMWASFKLEEGQQGWGLKVYKPEVRKPQPNPKRVPASGKRYPSPRQGPDYCALKGSYM